MISRNLMKRSKLGDFISSLPWHPTQFIKGFQLIAFLDGTCFIVGEIEANVSQWQFLRKLEWGWTNIGSRFAHFYNCETRLLKLILTVFDELNKVFDVVTHAERFMKHWHLLTHRFDVIWNLLLIQLFHSRSLQRKLWNRSQSDAQGNGHQVCSKVLETSTARSLLGEADPTWDCCASTERQLWTDCEASRCVWDAQRIHSDSWDVRNDLWF